MATTPRAIEGHIQTQIQINQEVIETAVTQHIDLRALAQPSFRTSR